jgi:hypothetical protein
MMLHLFLVPKKHMEGHRLKTDNNVERAVKQWLKEQDIHVYRLRMEELILQYDKYLSSHGLRK